MHEPLPEGVTPRFIDVPTGLVWEQLCPWSIRIDTSKPLRHTVFDLAKVSHAPPFGMLFAGACIRRYKREAFRVHYPAIGAPGVSNAAALQVINTIGLPTCRCTCNHSNSYLGHMGFWQSLGEDIGKVPGEARGSKSYLPITQINVGALQEEAHRRGLEVGDVIYDTADRLAGVLAQDAGDAVEQTIAYAIREMLRNAVEHSGASSLWYACQYWPTKNRVELAVLDEGVGVLGSLRRNPSLAVDSELRAIVMATERGVTGVPPRPAVRTIGGELAESRWTNAGWGLFVLRQLAMEAGSLLIVSNNASVLFQGERVMSFECSFQGTAVRLVLEPSKLRHLLRRILEASTADQPPSRLTPSMLARLRNSSL